jgi:hypothetical protein
VGVDLMRRHAHLAGTGAHTPTNQPGSEANPAPGQPDSDAGAATPSVQLTRYITDPSGVLTAAGRDDQRNRWTPRQH